MPRRAITTALQSGHKAPPTFSEQGTASMANHFASGCSELAKTQSAIFVPALEPSMLSDM
jgi:hypothetical protein